VDRKPAKWCIAKKKTTCRANQSGEGLGETPQNTGSRKGTVLCGGWVEKKWIKENICRSAHLVTTERKRGHSTAVGGPEHGPDCINGSVVLREEKGEQTGDRVQKPTACDVIIEKTTKKTRRER